jgi:myosin heavy subunit
MVPGLGKIEAGLGKLTSGPLGLLSAGLGALGAAAAYCTTALRDYAEMQDAVTRLDATLARTGQLTEDYRKRLQDLAGTMSEATAIADDKWINVLARLSQFGADSSNIEQYAKAVENLAGIMGGDIESAAHLMTRAMGGMFMGFSRLGIHLDETKDKTAKMTDLLKKLAELGEGQLAASTRTLSGQYRQLKVSLGELSDATGQQIAKTGIIQDILRVVTVATQAWQKVISQTIPVTDGLTNAQRVAAKAIESGESATTKAKEAMEQYKLSISKADEDLKELEASETKRLSHEEKLDKIEKDRETARVKAAVTRGQITKERGAELEYGIEQKYDLRTSKRQLQSTEQVQDARLKQMAELSDQLKKDKENEVAKSEYGIAHEEVANLINKLDSEIYKAQQNLARLQKEKKEYPTSKRGVTTGLLFGPEAMDKERALYDDLIKKQEEDIRTRIQPQMDRAQEKALTIPQYTEPRSEALQKESKDRLEKLRKEYAQTATDLTYQVEEDRKKREADAEERKIETSKGPVIGEPVTKPVIPRSRKTPGQWPITKPFGPQIPSLTREQREDKEEMELEMMRWQLAHPTSAPERPLGPPGSLAPSGISRTTGPSISDLAQSKIDDTSRKLIELLNADRSAQSKNLDMLSLIILDKKRYEDEMDRMKLLIKNAPSRQ